MKYLLALFLLIATPAWAENPREGTGLPLPRFVSLKSSEINARKGPGTRYPIEWVYRREGLPIEIIEEFGHWRKIRDMEGATGWLHKNMVEGTRHAVITGNTQTLLDEPEPNAPPVIKAESGVIGRLVECAIDWCRLQISGRKGWIEKKHLWGVYKKEIYNP